MNLKTNCTSCFKALSVPSRMKIFEYLAKVGSDSVSHIVGVVKLTQPTVSYHLKEMERSGLLKSRKAGKEVFYSVSHSCPYDNTSCVLD